MANTIEKDMLLVNKEAFHDVFYTLLKAMMPEEAVWHVNSFFYGYELGKQQTESKK